MKELPLYLQLYKKIKNDILSGEMKKGFKLPSKRVLATRMNISQNTVKNAYEQLLSEGYLVSEERKGYFVAEIKDLLFLDIEKNEKGGTLEEENKKEILYDFTYQGIDTNNFPFKTWKRNYKEVLDSLDRQHLLYSHPKGLASLRNSICTYLKESRGVNASSEQIIISSGTEFLFQTLFQILGKDYVYGLENPGFFKLHYLFKNTNISYKPINIDDYGACINEIRRKDIQIMCLTPSHQFPTGTIMPINRRIEIINWSIEDDKRFIIEDDYDSEFKYQGRSIPSLQGMDRGDKVIYMGSFSKSLFPSLRISYMVLPKRILKKYDNKLPFLISPVPLTDQLALEHFIEGGFFERHLNKMRTLYKKKRELITKELLKEKSNKIEISGAEAGLHLVLNVKNGMTEEELIKEALNNKIKVYGISKFYVEKITKKENDKEQIILGYSNLTKEEIKKGIIGLKKSWGI